LSSLVLSGAREPWDWQGENYSLEKTSDFGKFCCNLVPSTESMHEGNVLF